MKEMNNARLEYWNSRANMGLAAGSNDVCLKRLEIENICKHLTDCERVLDAGCGNGTTAISVLKEFHQVELSAFDYSPEMVKEVKNLAGNEGLGARIDVEIGNLLAPPFEGMLFDAIYTERSLINLDSLEQQLHCISMLSTRLKAGGKMILCEAFIEGLAEINSFRTPIGLSKIEPPWHNNYLSVDGIVKGLPSQLEVAEIDNFSSTYYFLSRVVNAWLAGEKGVEPAYDNPINKLSFSLPAIGVCAQTKTIVLQKRN
jgi:SAM-dependent methyltransferase